jgi:NAD(P)-dependent dehydrogenase (short-subunit alcohol dehydrogenase family)
MTDYKTDFSIEKKTALVTGGGSGIGRQLACVLATAGVNVVITGRRKEALMGTIATIESAGGVARAIVCDLTDFSQLENNCQRFCEPFGSPDILINAAGVNLRQETSDITEQDWDLTLDINLKVPFFIARHLIPAMKKKGDGKIINIASLQSERAFANSLPYGASKGGIMQMTRAMAEAWSQFGINCNAIAPGFFPTELTEAVFTDQQKVASLAAQTATGRNGVLSDLNGPLLFLVSQASNYVTGQTLYIDGGFTAK